MWALRPFLSTAKPASFASLEPVTGAFAYQAWRSIVLITPHYRPHNCLAGTLKA